MEYSASINAVDGEVYLLTLRDNHDVGNNLENLSSKY